MVVFGIARGGEEKLGEETTEGRYFGGDLGGKFEASEQRGRAVCLESRRGAAVSLVLGILKGNLRCL